MTEFPQPVDEAPEALLARISEDRARPRFHFTAPTGWLNDPNGLCQRDGVHHLFYQCNPTGGFHHRIQWGHATSRDLVHWTDQPVALRPGDGPDADGCWSGVVVDDAGTPTIVYSGHVGDTDLPCLATGSPDLLTWKKFAGNPVLTDLPGTELSGFRDHCVWREAGRWRMAIGTGDPGAGGFIALYDSRSTFVELPGPLLSGTALDWALDDPSWPGTMWECAELFRLAGEADVPLDGTRPGNDYLVFSAWHQGLTKHALYWSGSYADDRFVPADLHRLDLGGRYFYAPQSYRDESGRRVMFGWLQDARSVRRSVQAGWAGVMSLPRLVTERGDGTLRLEPVPGVALLRERVLSDSVERIGSGTVRIYPEVTGDQLDVEVVAALEPGAGIHIQLPGSEKADGGVGGAVVRIVRTGRDTLAVQLDRSATTRERGIDTGLRGGLAPVADDGTIGVRIVVDHSVLEIFVNGVALSARVHPQATTSPLAVRSIGMDLTTSVQAWEMADARPPGRL